MFVCKCMRVCDCQCVRGARARARVCVCVCVCERESFIAESTGLIAQNISLQITEGIHLFAIKTLLNVSPRMPNSLVYGETGRYRLYICIYTRCIKYWLNILRTEEDRTIMHCNIKNSWASSVCFTLYRYGYGHVWENQGVCDIRAFLCELKQRLTDSVSKDGIVTLIPRIAILLFFFFSFFFSLI